MVRVYEWEKTNHSDLELRILEARAKSGDAEANCAMADFYMRGRYHFLKNTQKAMRYLDEAMEEDTPNHFFFMPNG